MTPMWNVDLHSHTYWSKDSLTRFETIIEVCARRGIDRIAITDHNTIGGALALKKLAPELVIVGEEIMTTEGEILAYYVQENVPPGLTPAETIRRLRDQGAVISVSHPYDRLRKGAWRADDLLRIVDQVDAVEVFNARCLFAEDNVQAARFAEQHRLLGTAGSDAHTRPEYGRALTRLRPFDDNPASFLEALRQADYVRRLSGFYVHFGSSAAKWARRLKIAAPQPG